jgi:hypothetical protein
LGLILLSISLLSVLIPAAPFAWVENHIEIGAVKSTPIPDGWQWTFGPVSEMDFSSSALSSWHGKGIASACFLCAAFLIATLHLCHFPPFTPSR